MKMGEKGEADVLLIHSPDAEKNSWPTVSVRPAVLSCTTTSSLSVLRLNRQKLQGALARRDAPAHRPVRLAIFFSGDNSGTHAKEKSLWKSAATLTAEGQKWYQQTGLGIGQSL